MGFVMGGYPDATPALPQEQPRKGKEVLRGVFLRFPVAVYDRLSAEAATAEVPLTHYCYQLVVKRPEKVIDLPAQAKAELATVPVLKKQLAEMTSNWETRKKKYAGLETKLADLSKIPTLEKQVASLTKDRAAVAAERDALKATLATLRKRIGTGVFTVKCPSCREKVGLDLTDEMGLKQPGKPKPK